MNFNCKSYNKINMNFDQFFFVFVQPCFILPYKYNAILIIYEG